MSTCLCSDFDFCADLVGCKRTLPLCRVCGRPIGGGYVHGAWCIQYAHDNPFDVQRRFDEHEQRNRVATAKATGKKQA